MRPLTAPETKTLFAKLASYTGDSLKNLIAPLDNGDRWVFRMHRDRIYYVRLSLANLATAVARDRLLSLGVVSGYSADGWMGLSLSFRLEDRVHGWICTGAGSSYKCGC